jgi:hypothetical protein
MEQLRHSRTKKKTFLMFSHKLNNNICIGYLDVLKVRFTRITSHQIRVKETEPDPISPPDRG